jgi:hypothetical protein
MTSAIKEKLAETLQISLERAEDFGDLLHHQL